MQQADLLWTGPVKINTAKVSSTGGTLTLGHGSSLSSSGSMELSNGSTLDLKGEFIQSGGELSAVNTTIQLAGDISKTGGDLTSSTASLKLNENLTFSSDTPLSFKELTLNGKVLSFGQQTSSFTLSDELIINTPDGRIVQGSTALKLNGGVRIDSGGVVRLTDNFDTGTAKIKLNGGLLAIDSNTTLNSSIENKASSKIEIADSKNFIYEGGTLNIGAHELSIYGGGTFSNTNPLQLNDESSRLKLSRISASYVRTSSDSLGVTIDNSSSVNEFTVGHVTPVSISANQSLDGTVDIYSKGHLQLKNSGTVVATVTIKGDAFGTGTVGGKIEVKESMIFQVPSADNRS